MLARGDKLRSPGICLVVALLKRLHHIRTRVCVGKESFHPTVSVANAIRIAAYDV
jgi:hypothetical protein